jgi:hypothetical protein
VAAFLAEHLADRARKRKETIAVGLKAAAERERYAEIMRANLKVTGPSGTVGTTMLGTGEATRGARGGWSALEVRARRGYAASSRRALSSGSCPPTT